ncbi:PTS sugar transporter subunit IIB [Vibrio fluvialis]|uniref:PTS system, N-acetylgalactosamine-specific IIB component n=1 Tax=Vibrio fluvialis PG41 TaxID=1336752 RepID=S7JM12_VIBFL|nr:PTS sugar transporter subunit IIB [Vibrio fluvialis]EPP25161.1 PTS system, N-acetylgalactosamine-specific IIB component [Vibrio fluvialis PG41]WIE04264.1 PTS sugar transporter subunit IIB [Vibrio fluvialis]
MPNIVLSRIDERLVHGQVGVQWVGFADANIVVVANDEVAEDVADFQQLKALGVRCTIQGVPTESATDLFTLL